jgi:AraC family transcriptional regulator
MQLSERAVFLTTLVKRLLKCRQFKVATGLAPHQYVIARRVERAQQLPRGDGELGLGRSRSSSAFAHQSHFPFKRIVCVTPGQFRISARI